MDSAKELEEFLNFAFDSKIPLNGTGFIVNGKELLGRDDSKIRKFMPMFESMKNFYEEERSQNKELDVLNENNSKTYYLRTVKRLPNE